MSTAVMAEESLRPDVGYIRKNRMGYWHDRADGNLLVTPLVTEDMLAVAFLRFKSENLLDRIFSESQASLSWFLKHYMRDGISMLCCLEESPVTKQLTPCGLGWIVNRTPVGPPSFPTFYKAETGEAFFRHVSPRKTLIFGRLMIDWAFEHCQIAALYGSTPEPNTPGVWYARKLGFNVHGPLDYYTTWVDSKTGQREPCGAYISVMTKDQWDRREWR